MNTVAGCDSSTSRVGDPGALDAQTDHERRRTPLGAQGSRLSSSRRPSLTGDWWWEPAWSRSVARWARNHSYDSITAEALVWRASQCSSVWALVVSNHNDPL